MTKKREWNCVELFAGAGGLAIGAAQAGFKHLALVERDKHCCETLRHNTEDEDGAHETWPLFEADVRTIDFQQWEGRAQLVCGGPPCQPFSIGGKGGGSGDRRDMFAEAVRAVREVQPQAFVFENVKGLLRPVFSNYVEYIRLQLTYPHAARLRRESTEAHFRRLQRYHSRNRGPEPVYQVELNFANAANYGIPQKRHRVFFVGFRRDLRAEWSFPEETHSEAALDYTKSTGIYWERHNVARKHRIMVNDRALDLFDPSTDFLPWRTTRDAIQGLGKPRMTVDHGNHLFQPGARVYAGHTGSLLDQPAKTLKAGSHGVPGGENMVVLDDGTVRYLTVREAARLQTFPDEYTFVSSWTENTRQLGNAVPCELARLVVTSVKNSVAAALSAQELRLATVTPS